MTGASFAVSGGHWATTRPLKPTKTSCSTETSPTRMKCGKGRHERDSRHSFTFWRCFSPVAFVPSFSFRFSIASFPFRSLSRRGVDPHPAKCLGERCIASTAGKNDICRHQTMSYSLGYKNDKNASAAERIFCVFRAHQTCLVAASVLFLLNEI